MRKHLQYSQPVISMKGMPCPTWTLVCPSCAAIFTCD